MRETITTAVLPATLFGILFIGGKPELAPVIMFLSAISGKLDMVNRNLKERKGCPNPRARCGGEVD